MKYFKLNLYKYKFISWSVHIILLISCLSITNYKIFQHGFISFITVMFIFVCQLHTFAIIFTTVLLAQPNANYGSDHLSSSITHGLELVPWKNIYMFVEVHISGTQKWRLLQSSEPSESHNHHILSITRTQRLQNQYLLWSTNIITTLCWKTQACLTFIWTHLWQSFGRIDLTIWRLPLYFNNTQR